MLNSWIHLVDKNMEELAYLTCRSFDFSYQEKSARILATKYFKYSKI